MLLICYMLSQVVLVAKGSLASLCQKEAYDNQRFYSTYSHAMLRRAERQNPIGQLSGRRKETRAQKVSQALARSTASVFSATSWFSRKADVLAY
jgi:hypothetical protein